MTDCCPECKATDTKMLEELLKPEKVNALRARLQPRAPIPPRPLPPRFQMLFKASGKKGDIVELSEVFERRSYPQKFFASDSANDEGTRIKFPEGVFPSVEWFATKMWTSEAQALGCGMSFGIFEPGQKFSITVEFLADCEFQAWVIGAVRP